MDEKSLYRWKEQLRHIVADCKTQLQRKAALVRFGEMYWQPDGDVSLWQLSSRKEAECGETDRVSAVGLQFD